MFYNSSGKVSTSRRYFLCFAMFTIQIFSNLSNKIIYHIVYLGLHRKHKYESFIPSRLIVIVKENRTCRTAYSIEK